MNNIRELNSAEIEKLLKKYADIGYRFRPINMLVDDDILEEQLSKYLISIGKNRDAGDDWRCYKEEELMHCKEFKLRYLEWETLCEGIRINADRISSLFLRVSDNDTVCNRFIDMCEIDQELNIDNIRQMFLGLINVIEDSI